MKISGWRLALVCALILLAVAPLCAQADALQQGVDEVAARIRGWDRTARLAIAANVLVVLFGALVAGFQKIDKSWCRNSCLVLGIVIAALTGINNVLFPKDVKTLRLSVIDGRQVLRDMQMIRERLSGASGEDRAALLEEFRKRLEKISEIERRAVVARASEPQVTTVYAAEQALPFRIPDDPGNYYSVGTAADAALSVAKQKSYDDAVSKMCDQLKNTTARQEAGAASYCRALVLSSAAVANTNFSYDAGARQYRYSTLLRLNKAYGSGAAVQRLAPVGRASGEMPLTPGASRLGSLTVPVQAANPRDASFNFVFQCAPARTGGVNLQLDRIEVIQDGSVGSTRWLFQVFVNDKSVLEIPDRPYNDWPATRLVRVEPAERLNLNVPLGATIRVVGYRPRDLKQ